MLTEEALLFVHWGRVDFGVVGRSGLGEIVASEVEITEVVCELKLGAKTVLFREGF